MSTYFVTRHAGALAWARRQGLDAAAIPHLDPAAIRAGDTVIGNLPIHLAAAVCARGARFLALEIMVPPAKRGQELTAEEMEAFGACLVPYDVRRLDDAAPDPAG